MYRLQRTQDADAPILYEIHRDAMFSYVEQTWGWDEADQVQRFRNYASMVPLQVIIVDDQPAGFAHIDVTGDAVDVVNIELARHVQGRGIGTALLEQVIADANASGKPVRLQVLKANPDAKRLYDRMGFVVVGEMATHILMCRGRDDDITLAHLL
jgi:ribosomal protein S18 acetylase RimI-like enzyme